MRGLFIFFCVCFLFQGCSIFNSDKEEEEQQQLPPIYWSSRESFPGEGYKSIWVAPNDDIFVSADNSWFKSSNSGSSYTEYSYPDSLLSWRVKQIGSVYYGFGQHSSNYHVIGGDTTEILFWYSHLLYRSADGSDWEKISGPYDMYDFVKKGELIFIGKQNGVVVFNEITNEEFAVDFLFSKGLDFVDELAINSKGDIFAGTHDGIYRSKDSGKSWIRVTEEIHKDIDRVDKIIIMENDEIYAIGHSVLFSDDDGENWEILEFRMMDYEGEIQDLFFYDVEVTEDKVVYAINYLGFFMMRMGKDSVFNFYGSHKYESHSNESIDYEEIFPFSNGEILLSRWDNYVYHIGRRNFNSEYWYEN